VSDRAILAANVPVSEVGVYYLAYLASLPVALVAIALSQATQPLFVEAGLPEGLDANLRPATAAQCVLIVGTAVAVGVLGPVLTMLVLPADYAGAIQFIPWLAAGACFFGLYLIPMNAISITAGKTGRVWVITMIAAAINVVLNLALVPELGAIAAAVNTSVGYGILLIGILLYMRRVCDPPVPFDLGRIALGVIAVGVPSVLAALVTDANTLAGLIIRVVVLTGSAGLLMAGPFRAEAAAALRSIRPSRMLE
jgi:O-antigen/teichoic acid export membrane protein